MSGKVRRLQRPSCPPKPPDLAQRVKSMMDETGVRECQPGHNTFTSSQDSNTQLAYKIFNGSLDDLDIPYIDEDV